MNILGRKELLIAVIVGLICCGEKIHSYVTYISDKHKWNNHLTQLHDYQETLRKQELEKRKSVIMKSNSI